MNIPKEIALKGSDTVIEYIKYIDSYNEIRNKRNELVEQIESTYNEMTNKLYGRNDSLNLRMLGLNYFGLKRERLHIHALELEALSNKYLKLTTEFSALESQLMKLYEDSNDKGLLVGLDYERFTKCKFS